MLGGLGAPRQACTRCVAAARGRVDGQRVAAVMRKGQSPCTGHVSGVLGPHRQLSYEDSAAARCMKSAGLAGELL